MATEIGTGRSNRVSTRGQKAAETRANNTKAEVEFLAKTFFEFTQFAIQSGITDTQTIINNFDGMVGNYVQLGKIKQESYNKFKSFFSNSNINVRTLSKEDFISRVTQDFEKSVVNCNDSMLKALGNDFFALLQKYNITMPNECKQALFIDLGLNIAAIYKDKNLEGYFNTLKNSCGMSEVQFKGPQVITRYSDGCSGSRDVYSSLWNNLDRLNK